MHIKNHPPHHCFLSSPSSPFQSCLLLQKNYFSLHLFSAFHLTHSLPHSWKRKLFLLLAALAADEKPVAEIAIRGKVLFTNWKFRMTLVSHSLFRLDIVYTNFNLLLLSTPLTRLLFGSLINLILLPLLLLLLLREICFQVSVCVNQTNFNRIHWNKKSFPSLRGR